MKVIETQYLNGISGSGSGNDTSSRSGNTKSSNSGNSSSWSHMVQNAPTHIYGGTEECANGVFGALVENFPNPVKMGVGVAANAGLCLNKGSGNSGAFGGDSNANSVNGQCHW
ncbi:hypothetical protein [Rahnella ecdela]|uniref:Uncharacterized protein n=1 Tax=Rahnella ecdela TaxID=2816250 RepID=A0ABS6L9J4_9GAMM|nr:hypothetical protein [Rahnella ecdela]MBU9843603.1 hypothetical protein [Rahnella ecdela]